MNDINVHFTDYSYVTVECSESIFFEMREFFSFEVSGARFSPRFKYGGWDGKINLLEYNRRLPYGLANTCKIFANNMGYSIWVDPRINEQEDVSREDFDKWLSEKEIYSGDKRINPHWYQSEAVYNGIVNRRRILNLPTSAGKAQPLDRKILTPDGWSTIGDMKVGSVVLTPDGTPANVIAIHPQGVKEIYEITFKDGRKTQCCKEHLWRIFSHDFSKRNDKWRVMSLGDMMTMKGNHTRYIQTPRIEYVEKEFKIHPYLLGVLIGDGSLSQSQKSFVTMDQEIVDGINAVLPEGLKLNKTSEKGLANHYSIVDETFISGCNNRYTSVSSFKKELERLEICCTPCTKKIPDEYKTGSIEQRRQLLRGLIDTDGTVAKNGGLSFTTVSIQLANDVADIVRSIGGFASIKSKKTPSKFGICYTVNINHSEKEDFTTLPRKKERLSKGSRFNDKLAIVDIKRVEDQEAQCITIDSVDHLYITDDYIVTHNSLIQCLLSRWYLEHYTGKVLIIVPTTSLVTQMIDDFVDYRLFPRGAMLGIKGGTKRDSDALIYVSTWQTAIKQSPEWFQQFGMVMNDECHLATGASISKIINNLSECKFKFGLSGSLKDGKANLMQYVGMFGDIFKPVSTAQLMEEGQVTDLKINTVFLRYRDEETKLVKGCDYRSEIKYITSHKRRNAWVCKLAMNLAQKKNENVFLMFKNTKHGKWLFEAIKKHYDHVYYVDGTVDTDTRDALKKMSETATGVIVVASYGVFSTGISIKNLHHVIFAHPVKSKVTVLQSIGRVLRKHESKDLATVWDIIDHLAIKTKSPNAKKQYGSLNYALKHALERIQRYNEERFNYSMKTIEI